MSIITSLLNFFSDSTSSNWFKIGSVLVIICMAFVIYFQHDKIGTLETTISLYSTVNQYSNIMVKIGNKNNDILKDTINENTETTDKAIKSLNDMLLKERENFQYQLEKEREKYDALLDSKDKLATKADNIADEKTNKFVIKSLNNIVDNWNSNS